MKNLLTEKIFRLLDAVADAPGPVSLQELAETTGINRATASRILADLSAAGLVEKISYSRFVPAAGMLRYGEAALRGNPLCRECWDLLKSKAETLGASAFLGAWQSGHFFYVRRQENAPEQAASPLHSGLAAAIAAVAFPERETAAAELEKFAPALSGAERDFWMSLWKETQEKGYLELRCGLGFWSICFPFRHRSAIYGAAFCGENALMTPLDEMQFELSLLVSRLRSRLKSSERTLL